MEAALIKEYIDPQLLIILPMLWGIGMALKKSPVKNDYIPLILLVCSCLVAMLYLSGVKQAWTFRQVRALIFAGITQGSIIWLAAWMMYEKLLKD